MNSKVYKWCAVPQCKNTSISNPNKVFVHVPYNKTVRDKWLKLARRNPKDINTSSPIYFCQEHFDLPNDMQNYMEYHVMGTVSQVRMKPGCMPTKFTCQPDWEPQISNMEQPYIAKKRKKMILKESEKQNKESSKVTKPSRSKKTASSRSDNEESCCPEYEIQVLAESQMEQDPLGIKPKQCRFCFKITENTANVKSYIEDNKTTLTLNGVNIEIDFSNDSQIVCVECDKILLDTFNFVQRVRNAQSLLTQTLEEPVEIVVKTECDSPIPDDDDINEDAVEADDIPTEETVVNVFTHKKRKAEDTRRPTTKQKKNDVEHNTTKQKKNNVEDNTTKQKKNNVEDNKECDDSESNGDLMDIKAEDNEMDDRLEITETTIQYQYLEDGDTGPDVKPSEVDIACLNLLNAIRKKQ